MNRYTVQLVDRQTGRWYSWDFNLSYQTAKTQAAHAKERGEVARIVRSTERLTVGGTDMNEINHAYHSAPHKCKFCDYSLPATKNYRTGELSYPELPDGVCDECRDYLMEHAVGGKEMNDLTNTLLDIARTAVDHDPTLLNRMPCSITDGPSHPDEDADYDEYLEQQNQDWWQQIDEDEEWIGSFSDNHDMDHWRDCSDFAEHQEEDR